MSIQIRQTHCSACDGHGHFTDRDSYGFLDTRCDDCNGTGKQDASCAWCERIVPIDEDGYCADCTAPMTEVLGDPLLKQRRAA